MEAALLWGVGCAAAAFVLDPIVLFALTYSSERAGDTSPPAAVSSNPRPHPLLVVSFAFYAAVFLATTVAAAGRRHLQPFKSRNFLLLLVSSLAGLLLRTWVFASGYFEAGSGRCTATRWVMNLAYPLLTLPYLLRALRLHFVFRGARRGGAADHAMSASAFSTAGVSVSGTRYGGTPRGATGGQPVPVPLPSGGGSLRSLPPSVHSTLKTPEHGFSVNTPLTAREGGGYLPPTESPGPFVSPPRPMAASPESDATTTTGSAAGYHPRASARAAPAAAATAALLTPGTLSAYSSLGVYKSPASPPPRRYTNARMLWWLLLSVLPFVALAVAEDASGQELTPTFGGCLNIMRGSQRAGTTASALWHAAEAAALVASLALIWNVWDEFHMRGELAVVLLADIVIGTVQVVELAANKASPTGESARHLVSARCAAFFAVSMIWPLVTSYREERDGVGGGGSDDERHGGESVDAELDAARHLAGSEDVESLRSLEGVLGHVDGYECFARFMFAEGASELLEFYVECALLPDLADPRDRLERGTLIYERFMMDDDDAGGGGGGGQESRLLGGGAAARLGGHLSYHVVEGVSQGLVAAQVGDGEVTGALFAPAQEAVLSAMRREYFPRFRRGRLYRRLRSSVSANAAIRDSLQASEMVN